MKSIILVKNMKDSTSAKQIESALAQTRVDYEVNLDKGCVVIEGNTDMVAIARKVINELGYTII